MKRFRRSAIQLYSALCLGVAALGISACGAEDTASGGGNGSAEGKKVALISCTNENPWCNGFNKNVEKIFEADGVETTLLQSNFDSAAQAQQFSQAISQKPDAIMVHIADPNAILPSLLKAQRADVPVISVDTPVGKDAQEVLAATITPDHVKLGKFAAINIQEGLKKQGVKEGKVVMITGTASGTQTILRVEAFKKQMAKTPEYEIVEIQDGNWDPILTGTIARQLFAKYRGQGGIQAAYGMADYQAAAISQAAKQAGIPLYPASDKGMVVTGSNCATVGVAAIRKGEMYGGATQSPVTQGKETGKLMVDFLEGKDLGGDVIMTVDRTTRRNIEKFADVCTF